MRSWRRVRRYIRRHAIKNWWLSLGSFVLALLIYLGSYLWVTEYRQKQSVAVERAAQMLLSLSRRHEVTPIRFGLLAEIICMHEGNVLLVPGMLMTEMGAVVACDDGRKIYFMPTRP